MKKAELNELKIETRILEIYSKCKWRYKITDTNIKTIFQQKKPTDIAFNQQELETYKEEIIELMNQLKNEYPKKSDLYTNMLFSLANAIEKLDALNFKKRVLKVYSDCLLTFKKPWKAIINGNGTMGDGKTNDFIYNPKMIKKYRAEIVKLLCQLSLSKENPTFQEMKYLKNGQQWTELNFHTEILFSLANAINLIEFEKEKRIWDKNEKENPTINVKMKIK